MAADAGGGRKRKKVRKSDHVPPVGRLFFFFPEVDLLVCRWRESGDFIFFFSFLLLSRHQPSYSNVAHVSAKDNIKEGISRNGSKRNNPPGQATRVCHAGGGRGARQPLSAAATGAPLITRLMFCSRQTDRPRDRHMLDGQKDTGGGGGGGDRQVVALLPSQENSLCAQLQSSR